MTAELSIVIMAHPSRRARAELLASYVDADVIVYDDQAGEWANGAASWRYGAYLDANYTLVLQDDAEPIENVRAVLTAQLDAIPGQRALSVYLGRYKPARWQHNVSEAVDAAIEHGAQFIEASHLLHGVGLVLPTCWISPMLDWCDRPSRLEPYDQRIGAWLRRTNHGPILYTWPSLVEHGDGPSLVAHVDDEQRGTDGRVAYLVGVPRSTGLVSTVVTPAGAER